VEDGFEPLTGSGVGKNAPREFIAAQLAIRPGDLGTEGCQNLSEDRLARLHDLSGQLVGVHHRNPARAEELGRGGLAHADATR
jgi:hypothetical protein